MRKSIAKLIEERQNRRFIFDDAPEGFPNTWQAFKDQEIKFGKVSRETMKLIREKAPEKLGFYKQFGTLSETPDKTYEPSKMQCINIDCREVIFPKKIIKGKDEQGLPEVSWICPSCNHVFT